MIVLLIVFLLLHRSICRYQRKKGRQQGTLPDQIGCLAKELSYWLKADGMHEMIQRSDAFIDQMQKYERLSDDRTQKSPSNDLSQQSVLLRQINIFNGIFRKKLLQAILQKQEKIYRPIFGKRNAILSRFLQF